MIMCNALFGGAQTGFVYLPLPSTKFSTIGSMLLVRLNLGTKFLAPTRCTQCTHADMCNRLNLNLVLVIVLLVQRLVLNLVGKYNSGQILKNSRHVRSWPPLNGEPK
jgi:hypothetical protein